MEDISFMPNRKTIAFISTRFASPFISEVMEGAENVSYALRNKNQSIELFSTRTDKKIKKEILTDIYRARIASVAVMLFQKPDKDEADLFIEANIPLILIENTYPGLSSITVDNEKGSYEAGKLLVSKGRKKIAIISGLTGLDENEVMLARERGLIKAAAEAGVKIPAELIEKVLEYRLEEGAHFFESLITKEKNLDAVFCAAGDMVALGVIRRAKELGYRVPQDIAVIGFDDSVASALVSPALTTVKQPIRKMGEEAFKLALEFAEGKRKDPVNIVMPTELIIRESA